MESNIIPMLAVLVGLGVGTAGGFFWRRLISNSRLRDADRKASEVLSKAQDTHRRTVLEAKEEAVKIRSESEKEIRERRSEIHSHEKRISNREENAERRAKNLERSEHKLSEKLLEVERERSEVGELKQQEIQRLESISGLSVSAAKSELMHRAEEEIQHELSIKYRDAEEQVIAEADEKARNIIGLSISRLASDVVSEVTLTSVPLPNDEMKGRLIGREGRNIRAIEKATGVDLLIDDTPEAVTLSCFDPLRREVARLALTKLVADGRIHPARIEEVVEKCDRELNATIRKLGEQTVIDTSVRGLHPEIVKTLGRLKYRFSYGENVLQHSIEVGNLAGMIASEIGADIKTAKTGGLLHDLGKALTHEVEGPHAEIGADLAAKFKVPKHICATIREHHDDDHSSPESFIVAAADAISAARPGSRMDSVEHYIQRLEALEKVGHDFEGVQKCFAIQAGREIRVMVEPESIDDVAATQMARNISKKIEETLTYPGQIKVTVIRESRAVEYAK